MFSGVIFDGIVRTTEEKVLAERFLNLSSFSIICMKKILVAVDGSEFSEEAFDYSLDEAKKLDNHLTILRVVPGFGYAGYPVTGALEGEMEEAKMLVERLKKKAEKIGVDVDTEVISGESVSTEIVKFAEKGNYDLIVVGGRGQSDLGTVHLGSVSESVVKRAPCPVLIFR